MSNVEQTTSWQMIQQGVKEAERLIARKEYNLVMVKARQTLECMVRCMAERACLVEGDLADTIDQLYEGQWIDKSTKDNYHTIRILGNKAVHEGDDTAYSANQAYQLLAQEVHVFANEFSGQRRPRPAQGSRSSQPRSASRQTGASQRGQVSQRSRQTGGRPAQRPAYNGRSGGGSGSKKKRRQAADPVYYIIRLLIPILAVILLIVVIRVMMSGDQEDTRQTTTAPVTTEATTAAPEPEVPDEPETDAPAASYEISGSSVNVRTEPSTDSRILAQLSAGTPVTYVSQYNDEWAVINYDGQEAYVSSQYLRQVEAETTAPDQETDGTQETIEVE